MGGRAVLSSAPASVCRSVFGNRRCIPARSRTCIFEARLRRHSRQSARHPRPAGRGHQALADDQETGVGRHPAADMSPLDMSFAEAFATPSPEAYERLLFDALRGNASLFMRRDEVEAAWRFIDPIRDAWAHVGEGPRPYTAGTWGPPPPSRLSNATAALGTRSTNEQPNSRTSRIHERRRSRARLRRLERRNSPPSDRRARRGAARGFRRRNAAALFSRRCRSGRSIGRGYR